MASNNARNKKSRKGLASGAAALALVVAAIATQQLQGDDDQAVESGSSETFTATVQNVSDGDTVRVRLNGESIRVRILGLDAPEVHTNQDCGGQQSWDNLETMLHRGDEITLVADSTQDLYDQYDRMLAYVENEDGVDVGHAQIESGWARVYRKSSHIERHNAYLKAEQDARTNHRGIWGTC